MGKNIGFVEQFNKGDLSSNSETIKLINGLSNKQHKVLVNMVNAKYKVAFDEMRKRGDI